MPIAHETREILDLGESGISKYRLEEGKVVHHAVVRLGPYVGHLARRCGLWSGAIAEQGIHQCPLRGRSAASKRLEDSWPIRDVDLDGPAGPQHPAPLAQRLGQSGRMHVFEDVDSQDLLHLPLSEGKIPNVSSVLEVARTRIVVHMDVSRRGEGTAPELYPEGSDRASIKVQSPPQWRWDQGQPCRAALAQSPTGGPRGAVQDTATTRAHDPQGASGRGGNHAGRPIAIINART